MVFKTTTTMKPNKSASPCCSVEKQPINEDSQQENYGDGSMSDGAVEKKIKIYHCYLDIWVRSFL